MINRIETFIWYHLEQLHIRIRFCMTLYANISKNCPFQAIPGFWHPSTPLQSLAGNYSMSVVWLQMSYKKFCFEQKKYIGRFRTEMYDWISKWWISERWFWPVAEDCAQTFPPLIHTNSFAFRFISISGATAWPTEGFGLIFIVKGEYNPFFYTLLRRGL